MPPDLAPLGRLFIVLAGIFLVIGLALLFLPSIPRLPGDIYIERRNVSCWIPIATSIILSIVLTIGINLVLWLLRRMGGG